MLSNVSVGYTEILLIGGMAGLIFILFLRNGPYKTWGRAALIAISLATLATPADIFSTLIVFAGIMCCLWIGSRFMANPVPR